MGKTKIEILGEDKVDSTANDKPSTLRCCKSVVEFKRFLWVLRLSGMMYDSEVLGDPRACSCSTSNISKLGDARLTRTRIWKYCQLLYMALAHLLLAGMAIKNWTCFRRLKISLESHESQIHIVILIFTTTGSLLFTALAVKFSRELPSILQKLCSIQHKFAVKERWNFGAFSKIGILLLIICSIAVNLVSVATVLVPNLNLIVRSWLTVIVCPLDVDDLSFWNTTFRIWFSITGLLCSLGVLLATVIYVWLCKSAIHLFNQCSLQLQQEAVVKCLEFHRDICKWLILGNNIFKYFVLVVYMMTIPSICFSTNILLGSATDSPLFPIAIIDLVVLLGFLLLVVVTAASTNAKVAQIRGDIYDIVLADKTPRDLQLISLAVSNLNGTPVGITVADMLVIDKGHILTLLGILLTYTVLIVQFEP